jgi:hypothetical protein
MGVRSIARRTLAIAIASVLAFVFASRPCRAGDLPVHLTVQRGHDAGGCPDAAALAASIGHARGHGPPDVTPGADARLRLEVDMQRTPAGYHATVQILGARIGVREIEHTGRTCDPLAKALTVSLAVLIDDVEQSVAQDPPAPAPEAPSEPAPIDESPKPVPPPVSSSTPSPDGPSLAIRRSGPQEPPPDPEVSSGQRTAFNSVFAELGGPGIVYSINFERLLGQSNLSIRLGFSFIHIAGTFFGVTYNEADLSLPMVLNYYLGWSAHKIQLGFGFEVRHTEQDFVTGSSTDVLGVAIVGYRYVPPDGGVNLGIAFTPMFGGGHPLFPWGAMSLGFWF